MTVLVESRLILEPSSLAVRELGPWLRSAVDHSGPDHANALFSRAELAVHEACMNIIDHANLPPGSVLELHLTLRADSLSVRVNDPGDEFDISAVPSPKLHTLQERGYGMKIIRALVTDLSYRRVGSINELVLRIDYGSPID